MPGHGLRLASRPCVTVVTVPSPDIEAAAAAERVGGDGAGQARSHPTAEKLAGLQYLRAIASIAVVVFHAASKTGLGFEVGQAGVDIFFVLSGFLMWKVTARGTSPGRFLRDRIRRIVPIYWIVTTVLLVGASGGLFPAIRLTAAHVLTSYGFIASRSPSNGQLWPLLVPGWTLNYEMFFYAIFALILFAPRRRQLALLVLALAGLVVAGLIASPVDGVAAFYTSPLLLEFLAGVLLAARLEPGWTWPRSSGLMLCLASAIGFTLTWWMGISEPRALVYGMPAFLALSGTLALERNAVLPQSRLLRLLGDASYSIYLSHTLTISLVAKLAQRAGSPAPLTATLAALLGIAVGLLMYRWLERPIIEWLKPRARVARSSAEPAAR